MTIDELVSMLADIAADFGWSVAIGSDGTNVRGFVIGELEYVTDLLGDDCETWAPPSPDDEPLH